MKERRNAGKGTREPNPNQYPERQATSHAENGGLSSQKKMGGSASLINISDPRNNHRLCVPGQFAENFSKGQQM